VETLFYFSLTVLDYGLWVMPMTIKQSRVTVWALFSDASVIYNERMNAVRNTAVQYE